MSSSKTLESYVKGKPKKSDKHGHERSKNAHGSGGASSSSRSEPLSFLFVVNELLIDSGPDHSQLHWDPWANPLPPTFAAGYAGENISKVMRYRDGAVTLADRYWWGRTEPLADQTRAEGLICHYGFDGNPVSAELYSSLTTFSCNPHLPFVVVQGDPSAVDGLSQHPLLIHHPRQDADNFGLSQVVIDESKGMEVGAGPVKYVAGRDPSWMPSLLPEVFANPRSGAPRSKGLGGELPIVLALMAFSEARHRNAANEVFLGSGGHRGRWVDRKWRYDKKPKGYTLSAEDDPRGFLVAVFEDPENPTGSNAQTLHDFEWKKAIVKESSG